LMISEDVAAGLPEIYSFTAYIGRVKNKFPSNINGAFHVFRVWAIQRRVL